MLHVMVRGLKTRGYTTFKRQATRVSQGLAPLFVGLRWWMAKMRGRA